jgi:hypothetical protein
VRKISILVRPHFRLFVPEAIYGGQPLPASFEIADANQTIGPRVETLQALIKIRQQETPDNLLPDDFPVLPAYIDEISVPRIDKPEHLRVAFRPGLEGETVADRLRLACDVAPVVVDFVLGGFDPLTP